MDESLDGGEKGPDLICDLRPYRFDGTRSRLPLWLTRRCSWRSRIAFIRGQVLRTIITPLISQAIEGLSLSKRLHTRLILRGMGPPHSVNGDDPMRQTIRLGTFDGIPVGVHWSVAVIVGYFVWAVGAYVLPSQSGHPTAADWVAGIVAAVVLLACLLAHEVSHCIVARHDGVKVRSITLFAFGGVSQLEGEAHTPGADFRIAAVGPAVSLFLALVFAAAQAVIVTGGGQGVLVRVLSWLWEINLLLAVFNLIPAAPLDGGRILRAALWRRSGDHFRASLAASRAGRVFAVVLIVLGVLAFGSTGNIIGLWPLLIGLFIYFAARAEENYAMVQAAMATLTVGQVMTPALPTAPDHTTVADIASLLWLYHGDIAAVVDDGGRLTGVVTVKAVNAIPVERRTTTTANDIAISLSEISVACPEEPMVVLLERMASKPRDFALVLDADGRVCGNVGPADIQRAVVLGVCCSPQTGSASAHRSPER